MAEKNPEVRLRKNVYTMTDEVKNAQATENNDSNTEKTVEETTEDAGDSTEKTIGEMEGVDPQPEKRVVDQDVFVAEKKARKKAEKELQALRSSIEEGSSKEDISDDIDAISEEYDIDPAFLQKFARSIKSQTERELNASLDSRFNKTEREKKFDESFDNAFKKALEKGGEFKSLANKEVIKTLSKLPQNSNKTVLQLIEDTYGSALTGRATIETTRPGGGKDPEPLDFSRARKDSEYFKEIMKDPKRKEEYNKQMLEKGF